MGRDDRRAQYHPVIDHPGPVTRQQAWQEFARTEGEEGEAFAMFLLLSRAHHWLSARGYIAPDMGRIAPTDQGVGVLTRADGYEKYRTGGTP